MVLGIIFATIFNSYAMLATLIIPTPEPNQIKPGNPAFLKMSSFVVVEVGKDAVLECRVQNLARQFTVCPSPSSLISFDQATHTP